MQINNHFETSFLFWWSLGGENTCQVMLDTPPSEIFFFCFGHERVRVSWLYTRLHSYGIHGWRIIKRQLLNLDADRAQSGTNRTSKAELYINCHRDTYVEKNLWIPGGGLNWQWIHRDGFVVDCLHMAGCPKGTFTFADAARVSFKPGFKRLAI